MCQKITELEQICNTFVGSVLFTLGGGGGGGGGLSASLLSLLSFMLGCIAWMRREFLPRTEPYRQSKLYANFQSSLTIVVLTENKFACFVTFYDNSI